MNIGIRLHDVAGTGLRDRLIGAREQGFTCVHLALQKLLPGFKMANAPELLTEELAAQVKKDLEETGMSCALLGCYLNLATPDLNEYEHTLEIYKAHLRFAKMIGAALVGTETGAPNIGYTPDPACWTEESLQLFIRRVEPVVRYAEEVGQDFAIEPVVRHIVSTVDRTQRVLDALNSDRLHVILDTVNLLNMANVANCTQIVNDAFDRMGGKIRLLHMKDYLSVPGGVDVDSLGCGLGEMDYTALLTFAKAHPDVPMTLEDTKPENAAGCRQHLADKLAQL